MSLRDEIFERARQLGFAAVGCAAAAPSTSMAEYSHWLQQGRHAGMRYLERHLDLRADPGKFVPGARTILVVAGRYPTNPAPGHGFSTYARGRDYHLVFREKLKALASEIQTRTSCPVARVAVDSAPVLEREWAVRAGVGWLGKQGQVVHPELGACLLLGELLLGIDLEPSPPQANRCGTCRQCLDACPTRALRDNGHVDAAQCLSYLTIEHAGEIPASLRPAMGDTLFGCDACTAVCPWNREGEDKTMPELSGGMDLPDANALLTMTDEDFERRFMDHAAHRTGLERLQRNARVALANRGAV